MQCFCWRHFVLVPVTSLCGIFHPTACFFNGRYSQIAGVLSHRLSRYQHPFSLGLELCWPKKMTTCFCLYPSFLLFLLPLNSWETLLSSLGRGIRDALGYSELNPTRVICPASNLLAVSA